MTAKPLALAQFKKHHPFLSWSADEGNALLAECRAQRKQIKALLTDIALIEHMAISGLDGDTRAACDDIRLQAITALAEIE